MLMSCLNGMSSQQLQIRAGLTASTLECLFLHLPFKLMPASWIMPCNTAALMVKQFKPQNIHTFLISSIPGQNVLFSAIWLFSPGYKYTLLKFWLMHTQRNPEWVWVTGAQINNDYVSISPWTTFYPCIILIKGIFVSVFMYKGNFHPSLTTSLLTI